jgi:aminoglycoside phosphotransferase (APT) family kinase protein
MLAPADLHAPLEGWLLPRLAGAERVRLGEITRLGGGYSAETLIVPAQVTRGGSAREERYVLRREMPEPSVYPQQAPGLDVEIEIQWRAMSGLARAADLPLAPLVGFERDASLLGAPFFVMGFVEGQVPSVAPPYTSQGFFAEATPEQRRQLLEDGLRVLARIHAVDWQAAGFGWLVAPGTTPGVLAQLALWERYAERELAGRVHPVLARGLAWLHAHPPPAARLAVSWGDSRPGNMIWQGFRCVCVTDFENVAIAEPALDLGWWLMFDRWSHECFGAPRLPGEPTRDEQRAFYAGCAGTPVPDTRWHEIFAAARYCAIVVRVMNRSVARGELPADQTIWLNNPATTCLEQLLAEHT